MLQGRAVRRNLMGSAGQVTKASPTPTLPILLTNNNTTRNRAVSRHFCWCACERNMVRGPGDALPPLPPPAPQRAGEMTSTGCSARHRHTWPPRHHRHRSSGGHFIALSSRHSHQHRWLLKHQSSNESPAFHLRLALIPNYQWSMMTAPGFTLSKQ